MTQDLNAAPILSVERLTIALPPGAERANAVEDVSFEARAHEIVCIVGESGSGKSVSAFTIMGLNPPELKPLSGAIRLEGEEILNAPPERLRALRGARMAMIFQEPMTALNPVMTIGAQIEEVLRIHTDLNAKQRRARSREMVVAVHLPDPDRILDAYPHQLSGGQRQRAMIASALILDPALLIADEPTTALDVTTQAQILKLIKDLKKRRGAAIIFVTHDFGVVAEIADRVVVMRKGAIIEQGPAQEVLRAPKHPYTQSLIAAVPKLAPPARDPTQVAAIERAPKVLTTENVTKIYAEKGFFRSRRKVAALSQASIFVRAGEVLGVVGESGSGKSTLARCAVRLLEPTSGAMTLEGRDYARLSERALRPLRKTIQIVFQDPYRSLNPRRTIGQNIQEAPMNFGASAEFSRARAIELLRLVGLDAHAMERFPHQFSGGQRQRICIARALAPEPKILIADEAVSALDVSVQAQVLKLLDDIRRRFSLGVLFITHDLRVAAQICDRIAVMRGGEVVEQGDVREIFADPQSDYTKALFAAAPGKDFFA